MTTAPDALPDALIGHSGFVGGNLLRQRRFGATFRSTDIAGIENRRFGTVVCAGVTAVKWWANANPEEDRRRIEALIRHLDRTEAERFVLISTVDVFARPLGVTEDDAPTLDGLHAYGANRAMLERFVAGRFARHHILRLPALFGHGLKKNAIYDLMHDNRLEVIPPDGRFQWYPLRRLAADIDLVVKAGLPVAHLATAPLAMEDIRHRFFPNKAIGGAAPPHPAGYDMRTRHDRLFGGTHGYILDEAGVMDELGRFLADPDA